MTSSSRSFELGVDRFQPHPPHQTPNPLAVDRQAFALELSGHPAATEERIVRSNLTH
jgi:hypothetical protein